MEENEIEKVKVVQAFVEDKWTVEINGKKVGEPEAFSTIIEEGEKNLEEGKDYHFVYIFHSRDIETFEDIEEDYGIEAHKSTVNGINYIDVRAVNKSGEMLGACDFDGSVLMIELYPVDEKLIKF
jgi:hypothetical protein